MVRINISNLSAQIKKLEQKRVEAISTIDERIEEAEKRVYRANEALVKLQDDKISLVGETTEDANK